MQRQVPRSARLFSAAVERSRLPRSWKNRATAAATSFRDQPNTAPDRQDITLKRLGRVGVVEIASSMVSVGVTEGKRERSRWKCPFFFFNIQ